LVQAWLSGDRATIERLIAPEWRLTGPDGQVSDRASVLAEVFETRSFGSPIRSYGATDNGVPSLRTPASKRRDEPRSGRHNRDAGCDLTQINVT
jgi:hypothetical protein